MKMIGRLAILAGVMLIVWAGALWFQDQREGYEAGERAEALLNEVWAVVRVRMGIGDVSADEDVSEAGEALTVLPQTFDPASNEPESLDTNRERVLDKEYAGILEIPSLNLTLCIYEDWSYRLLDNSPCRFMGDADGAPNRLVIVGHNYKRHFGKLKQLREGDQILYMNMYGDTFSYTVVGQATIGPRDFEGLEEGDWDVALVTCTSGGRLRYAVKCK